MLTQTAVFLPSFLTLIQKLGVIKNIFLLFTFKNVTVCVPPDYLCVTKPSTSCFMVNNTGIVGSQYKKLFTVHQNTYEYILSASLLESGICYAHNLALPFLYGINSLQA